jgi:Fe-Mn family superoxide dismutase
MMGPAKVSMPSELENAITSSFGSVDKFKEDFCNAGATQFGSGWCWLVKDKDGSLKVTKTENGVNPVCFGQTALLGCDVWEHSYYIARCASPTMRSMATALLRLQLWIHTGHLRLTQ